MLLPDLTHILLASNAHCIKLICDGIICMAYLSIFAVVAVRSSASSFSTRPVLLSAQTNQNWTCHSFSSSAGNLPQSARAHVVNQLIWHHCETHGPCLRLSIKGPFCTLFGSHMAIWWNTSRLSLVKLSVVCAAKEIQDVLYPVTLFTGSADTPWIWNDQLSESQKS